MGMSERQDAPDPPSYAKIPLGHKRYPTEMLSSEEKEGVICVALVGEVDIQELRSQIVSLTDEEWEEEYNRKENVYFQRPFHDKLGVKNIMCIFSDTQLQNVYLLPFYERYKVYLEEIFKTMNIVPTQVVRCLFARMPGDTLIPSHHDNGPWVRKTHRVHVPIVTFSSVEFKAGVSDSNLKRYAFNEATIVELNNAAKHSVHNKSKKHRIHLIFDYVESSHRYTKHFLKPGQVCRQVRGQVELVDQVDKEKELLGKKKANKMLQDLEKYIAEQTSNLEIAQGVIKVCRHYFIEQISAKDFVRIVAEKITNNSVRLTTFQKFLDIFELVDQRMGQEIKASLTPKDRPLIHALLHQQHPPHFSILGVQKSGTTSLFDYLNQHSKILRGKRREPHFFDWNYTAAVNYQLSQTEKEQFSQIISAYDPNTDINEMKMKYLMSFKFQDPTVLAPPMLTGESTPSYLLYGKPVAQRIKELYPDMKFFVMLRNPVKRAYSQYQMTADSEGTGVQLKMREAVKGKTFEEVIEEDMKLLKKANIAPLCDPNDFQQYADQLSQEHGSHSYVGRGLYALQLEIWFEVFPREQFMIIDLDDLKSHEGIQRQVNLAFEFLGLQPEEIQDTVRKNTRAYDPIPKEMAEKLETFYKPYTERLFRLLGRRMKW